VRRWWLGSAALLAVGGCLCLVTSASAFVYWTNELGDSIGRANLDGTGVNQSFIKTATDGPIGVAVDAQYVYWDNSGVGKIGRAFLDGTAADQGFITDTDPWGVAVDSQHVYWSSLGRLAIGRANLDSSNQIPNFMTAAAAAAVAVDAHYIYWASDSTIGRANLDGSDPNPNFITGTNMPLGVAVDGQHVYWSNFGANSIGRANLNGTGVNQSFITGAKEPKGVAVDDHYIYWANDRSGTIGRADLDGTAANQSFISGANAPFGVAVDSLPHASRMTLACAPAVVTPNAEASCTATLMDTGPFSGPPGATAPIGTVGFSSSGAGTFTPAASCSLVGTAAGKSVCELTYRPSANGDQTISAVYAGDLDHTPSNGVTTLEAVAAPIQPPGPRLGVIHTSHKTFREGDKLASLAATRRRPKPPVGTRFTFALNTAATVQLTFTHRVSGRDVKRQCVARSNHNKRDHHCERTITAGTLTFTAHAGTDRITFQGRLASKHELTPGRYTLKVVAANATGRASTRSTTFTIVNGRQLPNLTLSSRA
jgi:virginiamycin B lyase